MDDRRGCFQGGSGGVAWSSEGSWRDRDWQIVGIATILGAVLVSQDVAGWIVGLAVGLTSVILAALLWSSRQL